MQDSPFYHGSIRKIAAAFGTIFDEIKIIKETRSGDKEIHVPLNWGPKQHYYMAAKRKGQDDHGVTSKDLPYISYFLQGMGYNSVVAGNPLNRYSIEIDERTKKSMYAPAPYMFNFEVVIFANNTTDSYKILEQILPHFRPSVNITAKTMDEMDVEENINITLDSVTPDDNWEEQSNTNRVITWTLSFSVEGHIFPAIRDSKIITNVIVDVENMCLDPTRLMETIEVDEDENVTITENKD